MAPEIFAGNPYDPRAVDVWCLAIMYCHLILGRSPWHSAQQSDPSFRSFSKQSSTCRSLDEFAQNSTTGPATLLKELPNESRLALKGMLQLTPGRRLSIRQVLQHPWVKQLSVCSQDSDGKVHRATGHDHTLVSDSLSPTTSRKDSNMEE
jgi:serine/threonine protein kinase